VKGSRGNENRMNNITAKGYYKDTLYKITGSFMPIKKI
jgi:hypothetical protein